MSYIAKKPEKLASAVYLITSFFSDQEPMKWRLRSLASDLASLGLYLRDNFSREREQASFEMRSTILETVTLLGVARNSNLISDTNAEIITRELYKYLSSIGLPAGVTEENEKLLFSSNFFALDARTRDTALPESENQQKDIIPKQNQAPIPESPKSQSSVLDRSEPKKFEYLSETDIKRVEDHNKDEKSKDLKAFGVVSVKKNARQSIIINLLKRKKEIMIKDVSPLINGCSEKTIQRELLAMVKAGVLRKVGEKRWSRYTLA